ncbi:hypothetical protein NEA10_02435 [Phormidium yuhuli AB48]|uniref:Uncharacterized protein n=1 Tax=Phormidium yuhuli AB48 TaxID=2940671 RepID=A0ABY5AQW0_9CYAN|nr:hypothetical protein [Phormidium yuhuli]USR91605.1 hypothetical protein NEA10_02435 [Phormidium yuhuli AB48]
MNMIWESWLYCNHKTSICEAILLRFDEDHSGMIMATLLEGDRPPSGKLISG